MSPALIPLHPLMWLVQLVQQGQWLPWRRTEKGPSIPTWTLAIPLPSRLLVLSGHLHHPFSRSWFIISRKSQGRQTPSFIFGRGFLSLCSEVTQPQLWAPLTHRLYYLLLIYLFIFIYHFTFFPPLFFFTYHLS